MSTDWPRCSGIDTGDYGGFIATMENRRQYFKDNGAVSSDHSHFDARTDTLEVSEAERIYAAARKGEVSESEATALRRHLVSEMARMACDDGLVMTLHPGVRRNHHLPTFEKYGADVGTDIPVQMEFTEALRPMLNRYGTHPNFQLIIFTIDETVFSRRSPARRLLPVGVRRRPVVVPRRAGGIRRYRAAITESAGFAKTSGFIDDTRAFCSIQPGMTCPAGLTQGTWPSWWVSTDSVRLRPSRSCMIWSSPTREGHSSCDRASRSSSSFPFAARHAGSSASPDRPSRRRQLPSGPSSVVHRPQPRRRPVGDRGLHGPADRHGRRIEAAGRPLHLDHPQR